MNDAVMGDTRVEEARLIAAREQIPDCVNGFLPLVESLAESLARDSSFEGALQSCYDHGLALWRGAAQEVQRSAIKDDRPLYWGRLQMLQQVREQSFAFAIDEPQRARLLLALEVASRGRTSAHFTQSNSRRILVSGFDPFGFTTTKAAENNAGEETLVDLSVSNPSGAAALELSNRLLAHEGRVAEVQSCIFPVRYEDFDLGVVERFFAPYFEAQRVDMIVTISRGRTGFDLERFTGRRRSSRGRDNAGRSIDDADPVPNLPQANSAPLGGPEFLESSLPIAALSALQSHYPIHDNCTVSYLNYQGEAEPLVAESLTDLADMIAAGGSGGGFLSNEISYRTHLLRDKMKHDLPVGHIHVPKPENSPNADRPTLLEAHELLANQAIIVSQIIELLKVALLSI